MAQSVKLVVVSGARRGREILIKSDHTVIGRRRSCQICIPAADVSREHCAIVIESGRVLVRDLASSNGTWVNGQQVTEAELRPGDTLTIGPVVFAVQFEGTGGPADTARPGEQPALEAEPLAAEPVEENTEPALAVTPPPAPPEPPTSKIPAPAETETPPQPRVVEEADFEIVDAELVEDAELAEEEPAQAGEDEITQFFLEIDEGKK